MKKILIVLCLLFLAACASKGQKSFDAGNQFYLEEQWRDAIFLLRNAIAQDPEVPLFHERLKQAEDQFLQQQLGNIQLEEDTKLSPERIKGIDELLGSIASVIPHHQKLIDFQERFETAKKNYYGTVNDLYARGRTALRNNQYPEAKQALTQIKSLYPGYKDIDELLREIQRRTGFSKAEGVRQLIVEEKYSKAREGIEELKSADPNNAKITELEELLRFRDSYFYYINIANGLLKENLLSQAKVIYEKTLTYNPEDPYAKNQIFEIDRQVAEDFYFSGKKALILGDLITSQELFQKTIEAFPGIIQDKGFIKANNRLIKELDVYKHKAIQDKYWGTALALEEKIMELHDTRNEIKKKHDLFEEEVKRDITLKLGLLTFDDPDPDNAKGKLFSDLLYARLLESKLQGLSIVNQEFVTADLKKGKKKISGLLDKETLEYLNEASGISLVISGKILFMDLNTVDTPKLSLKKIPLETVENEAVEASDPTVPAEPKPEKKYRIVEIKSGSVKKTSNISLIYTFYDAYSAMQILTDAFDKEDVAIDNYITGFESEGIESDPLEIPSDTEMATKAMRSAVDSILNEILAQLSQPGLFYMERGVHLRNARKYNEEIYTLLRAKYLLSEDVHYKIDGMVDDALRKIIIPRRR